MQLIQNVEFVKGYHSGTQELKYITAYERELKNFFFINYKASHIERN